MRECEQDNNHGGDEGTPPAGDAPDTAAPLTSERAGEASDTVSNAEQGGSLEREKRAASFARRALIRAGWSVPIIAAVDLATTKKAMALTWFINHGNHSNGP